MTADKTASSLSLVLLSTRTVILIPFPVLYFHEQWQHLILQVCTFALRILPQLSFKKNKTMQMNKMKNTRIYQIINKCFTFRTAL